MNSDIVHMKVKVTPFLTLWDPVDYTVHEILQTRILEWVTFPFSRESSQPRDQNQVSHIVGGFFTSWATREAQEYWNGWLLPFPGDLPDPGPRNQTGDSWIADGFYTSWTSKGNSVCMKIQEDPSQDSILPTANLIQEGKSNCVLQHTSYEMQRELNPEGCFCIIKSLLITKIPRRTGIKLF